MVVGAILFHILNMILMDGDVGSLSYSTLWLYALPYGFVYYFMGQIAWLTSLELNPPVTISIGTNVNFILSLVFAAGVVRQYPDDSEWVASSIIFAGIVSSICEILCRSHDEDIEEDGGEEYKGDDVLNALQTSDTTGSYK